jgi:putative N6-adenine-specific DNA methylase
VLADELGALGAHQVTPASGGVAFAGDRALLYRANLWLRTANRVLVPLAEGSCRSAEELYRLARGLDWPARLTPQMTVAVEAAVRDSTLAHSRFVEQKTKDAIVDAVREATGRRPSVDVAFPSLRVHVRLLRDRATLSLDASGRSLHERGYRVAGGPAPLKETLAAAVVLLSGWQPALPLVNPMCGTGTLAIEAALVAAGRPPGLGRRFGFETWRDLDRALWQRVQKQAERSPAPPFGAPILASDQDARAVAATRRNVTAAGVAERVHVERCAAEQVHVPAGLPPGVILVNPPYGERLGDEGRLAPLYRALGDAWKQRFDGWTAWILTGNPRLAGAVGLRPSRRIPLFNGPIECRLLRYALYAPARLKGTDPPAGPPRGSAAKGSRR